MPSGGGTFRASQISTLASLHHERLISDRYRDLIDQAANGSEDPWEQADVREARRLHEKAKKLPPSLVSELARTTSLAYAAWVAARRDSDFPAFAPWLTRILNLKRRQAECLGIDNSPTCGAPWLLSPGIRKRPCPPGVAPSGPVRYRHWQVCTTNASSRTGTGTWRDPL